MTGSAAGLPSIPFLEDFVVILLAAVVVILASHALRLPPVIGFLLTGLIIGPHGFGFVTDASLIHTFAEIGVVFLLFTVGLEFSPQRLREIGRAFFLGGGLQTGLTILAVAALFWSLERPGPQALFYGFLAALSSTAIILKLYTDRRELDTPQGKLVIGILLFQDMLLVPLIILTPVLAGQVEATVGGVLGRFGLGLLVVGLVFLAARTLMARLLRAVVRTRTRELLILGALLAGLGMALVTESFGFSLALGAFLAGILISESLYSHQVVAEMTPFRDVFTSLFFIAIGMLLEVDFALANLAPILAVVGGIVAVKAMIVTLVVLALRFPIRVATIVALSLAQVGEFSFVLASVGLRDGLVSAGSYQIFLAAAILTMMATPFLIRWSPVIADHIQKLPVSLRKPLEDPAVEEAASKPHVIVVGFGVNGRNLARVLRSVGVPYVVLELNGEIVRQARQEGEPIVFGDATRREVLEACGIDRAQAIVLGISDLEAVRRSVRLSRELNPRTHIVVRTRLVAEIDSLLAVGADEVVAEEFETSIEIFTRVLERLHVPTNVIEAEAKVLRGDAYRRLRGPLGAGRISEAVLDILAAGTTAVFYVREESPSVGHPLASLDLRRRTGATVIAIVRGGTPRPNPAPDFRLEAGDSMVLVGSHAEITRAFEVLEEEEIA